LLKQRDERIRVLRLEGRGVSGARNAGMQASRGEYITFLDADDVWCPGKVRVQVDYMQRHPEVGCVFGRFLRWFSDEQGQFPPADSLTQPCGLGVGAEPERSGWLYTRLLTGLLVGMNTAMIRRDVFEMLGGFDESMRIGEDYMFWLKVSRAYEMHSLDTMVALYRIHGASAMRKLDPVNHQYNVLKVAVARWGLSNPDGSGLPKEQFAKRMAECAFTHAYNHFWGGSLAVARHSFFMSLRGGFLPWRSALYIVLSPFRGLVRRM
jgi:glycosyltransferase involved in cell wall biosynthesis